MFKSLEGRSQYGVGHQLISITNYSLGNHPKMTLINANLGIDIIHLAQLAKQNPHIDLVMITIVKSSKMQAVSD